MRAAAWRRGPRAGARAADLALGGLELAGLAEGADAERAFVAGIALGHAGPAEHVRAVLLPRLQASGADAGGAVGAGREGHGVGAAGGAGGVGDVVLIEAVGAWSANDGAVWQILHEVEARWHWQLAALCVSTTTLPAWQAVSWQALPTTA